MKLCPACLLRPEGQEGHRDLRLDVFATADHGANTFICEACRASWRRSYTGSAQFEWQFLEPAITG
jgi:hypothetical protein